MDFVEAVLYLSGGLKWVQLEGIDVSKALCVAVPQFGKSSTGAC